LRLYCLTGIPAQLIQTENGLMILPCFPCLVKTLFVFNSGSLLRRCSVFAGFLMRRYCSLFLLCSLQQTIYHQFILEPVILCCFSPRFPLLYHFPNCWQQFFYMYMAPFWTLQYPLCSFYCPAQGVFFLLFPFFKKQSICGGFFDTYRSNCSP